MNWDEIENELRRNQDSAYPIDTDELWRSVQPHIPTERKERGRVFFLIFGLLCMTCMSWMYINHNLQKSSSKKSQISGEEQTIEYATKTQSNHNQLSQSINHNEPSNDRSSVVSSTTGTPTKTHAASGTPSADHSITNKAINTNTKSNIIKSSIDIINPTTSHTVSNVSKAKHYDVSISQAESVHQPTPMTIKTAQVFSYLERLGPSPIAVSTLDVVVPTAVLTSPIEIQTTPVVRWFAEIQGSLTYGHGAVSSTPESTAKYPTQRANEESLPSFGFGGNIGAQLNANWSILAGVQYNHLYKYSSGTLLISNDIQVDNVVTTELITADGVQPIQGTVTAQEQYDRNARRVVNYQQLNLPVSILYGRNSKKWGWDIGLGAAASLWQKKSGYIHIDTENEYDISVDEKKLYSDAPQWSAHAIVGGRYHIGHGLDLYARSRYSHYLTNYSSATSPWKESLSGLHMDIGLRFHL